MARVLAPELLALSGADSSDQDMVAGVLAALCERHPEQKAKGAEMIADLKANGM